MAKLRQLPGRCRQTEPWRKASQPPVSPIFRLRGAPKRRFRLRRSYGATGSAAPKRVARRRVGATAAQSAGLGDTRGQRVWTPTQLSGEQPATQQTWKSALRWRCRCALCLVGPGCERAGAAQDVLLSAAMTRVSIRWPRLAVEDRPQREDLIPYQYPFGCFALVPACLAVGAELRHSMLGQSQPVLLWLILLAACAGFYAGALLWARLVPALASLTIGLIGWTFGLWLVFHGQF